VTSTPVIWAPPTARPSTFVGPPSAIINKLTTRLEAVGLPGELAASRRLVARAEEVREAVRRGQVAATERLEAARARLLGAEVIDGGEYAAALRETAPWLDSDIAAGRGAPAVAGLMQIASELDGRSLAMVNAEASGVFGRLQGKAAQLVAEIKGAPRLPDKVWSAPKDQAAKIAIESNCELTWATLTRATARWLQILEVAYLLIDSGGLGFLNYPSGCPSEVGLRYLGWVEVEAGGGQELRRLAEPLQLLAAIDRDYRPGIWLPADHRAKPQPKRGLVAVVGGLVGR
jgi:hypothetical protein